MSWAIESIERTRDGLRVNFVRHSSYVGHPSERVAGLFTKWVEIGDTRQEPLPASALGGQALEAPNA